MKRAVNKARTTGLSVVIPTLNRVDLVMQAIESVTTLYPELVEIIVVDDGSIEDLRTKLPARNTSDVLIRGYRFERNRGPQAARNLGIRRARFSHIAFLDSDDEFTTKKIDTVLQVLNSQEIDLLFHATIGMPRYALLARSWSSHIQKLVPFTWISIVYNPVVTPALVIRRRCRLGLPAMRYCEDWFFLLRYIDADMSVIYLDQELSTVHRKPGTHGGLSGSVWMMRKGEFKARAILLREPNINNIARYIVGSLFGIGRIVSDIIRGRYWKLS